MILFFKLKICNMYIFCMIEFLHVYRFDLTHSECNMALFFFFIRHVYCFFHVTSFGVLDFFMNIFQNESQIKSFD